MPVHGSKIVHSDFFNTRFDAIIAHGLIIHLPQDQQKKVIEKVSNHLLSNGTFLYNSSDEDGARMAPPEYNGGERFMTYSMSSSNFQRALHNNGMILRNQYIEKDTGGTIDIAKKNSTQAISTNIQNHVIE